MNEEQRINLCKTSVGQIYRMLQDAPQTWRRYIHLARAVITQVDSTSLMRQSLRTAEQVWLVAGLQGLVLADPDIAETMDISNWCTRQWLTIAQQNPTNVEALRGMGLSWYARAAPMLRRINQTDRSPPSSDSTQGSILSITASEDERLNTAELAAAERRVGTPDYVQVRHFLQPAVEYLERAVAAATVQGVLSGDLLARTAEVYLSLGAVSSPRINEQFFRRALTLLNAAAAVPGYRLEADLQRYLDEYGRLL